MTDDGDGVRIRVVRGHADDTEVAARAVAVLALARDGQQTRRPVGGDPSRWAQAGRREAMGGLAGAGSVTRR